MFLEEGRLVGMETICCRYHTKGDRGVAVHTKVLCMVRASPRCCYILPCGDKRTEQLSEAGSGARYEIRS